MNRYAVVLKSPHWPDVDGDVLTAVAQVGSRIEPPLWNDAIATPLGKGEITEFGKPVIPP